MIKRAILPTVLGLALLLVGTAAFGAGEELTPALEGPPFVPPLWTVLPFIGILLSIAIFPLAAHHFWEHHYPKVSAAWLVLAFIFMWISVPADMGFLEAYGPRIFTTYEEYVAFIILLGSLFVISGGIYVRGDLTGTPGLNSVILLIGSLLASLIGTTGAAMLLIRPLLRANSHRDNQAHVVLFFIFLVCNIGGALTPIGDPPLFLGFLQGIPFTWTLALMPHWAFAIVLVLGGFYLFDSFLYRREFADKPAPQPTGYSVRIEGAFNFVLLLGVVALVVMSGALHVETVIRVGTLGVLHIPALLRDGGQIVLALVSLWLTPRAVRESNGFNYEPIREVAYLFIGIFTCMMPALMLLNARGDELGLTTAAHYFWVTGALSSFLDNAPTYLTFLYTAMGYLHLDSAVQMTQSADAELILKGISAGAVFMGAMTYIGNAPNFMVKAIAEGSGIRMPSFFGYLMYSSIVLLPVFVLVTLIFF